MELKKKCKKKISFFKQIFFKKWENSREKKPFSKKKKEDKKIELKRERRVRYDTIIDREKYFYLQETK